MFQDPSIGEIKVYYAVTKIIVLESIEVVRISEHCKEICNYVNNFTTFCLVNIIKNLSYKYIKMPLGKKKTKLLNKKIISQAFRWLCLC